MNFLKKLTSKFSKEDFHDVDLTLADGAIATVVTEGEEPKEGDIVKDSEGKPLADGDHLLADGRTLVVEGGSGAIKEIKPVAEPAPKEGDEPSMTEVMQSISSLSNQIKQFSTKFESSIKETQEGVELIADKFGDFDSRLTNLGKTVKSKYDAPEGEVSGKGKKPEGFDVDAVAEARKNLKNKNQKA